MTRWQFTPDEFEYQFNPQNSVQDFSRFQQHRNAVSEICRAVLPSHKDVKYGDGKLHTVDIYPAGDDAPVHMFFHGGYWRTQDKMNFAFIARDLVQRGITLVCVNYELCPAATLDDVSSSALKAIAWCYENIRRYGGDPDRISVSGNSAGAHLCSMAIACDWQERGLPKNIINAAIMISGIYDPSPARKISVNAELSLTEEICARNNTEVLVPRVECKIWLFAGGLETWAWITQTFNYSSHLRRCGYDPEVHILPGYHHFNIMDQYLEPDSPISRAIQAASSGK